LNEVKFYLMNYKIHHPKHIYNSRFLFITARTLNKVEYFISKESKDIFKDVLKNCLKRFAIKVFSWVLLNNHYHLLIELPDRSDFPASLAGQSDTPKIMPKFRIDQPECNCIKRSDDYKYILVEFFRKLHKDTSRILNSVDNTPARQIWYQYSTNSHYVNAWGLDGVNECLAKYPVRDWTPSEGD